MNILSRCMSCGGTREQNIEATLFAAYLLVPNYLLSKERPVDLTDDEAVNSMAKKYKVPVGLMVFRLGMFYEEKRAKESRK